MKPLTNFIPKEILPIAFKPAIEYILDKIIQSKIKKVAVVFTKKRKCLKTILH